MLLKFLREWSDVGCVSVTEHIRNNLEWITSYLVIWRNVVLGHMYS